MREEALKALIQVATGLVEELVPIVIEAARGNAVSVEEARDKLKQTLDSGIAYLDGIDAMLASDRAKADAIVSEAKSAS